MFFYSNDLKFTERNNDEENIAKLNSILNTLSKKLEQKNIKLIVLAAPDKFDIYYDHIVVKDQFLKPLFFDLMKNTKKEYIYIDSKAVLSAELNKKQDLYYYGDSHWSPVATDIIAKEIKTRIQLMK